MASSSDAMLLAPHDNVAIALRTLRAGERVLVDGVAVTIQRDVALGHKFAPRALAAGETIVKYQCPIGRATRAIAAGEYVHTHNVESAYLPTYTLPT